MKMDNLVVTIKSWNIANFWKMKEEDKDNNWHLITNKEEFTFEKVAEISPRYIFFPHWSWIIPEKIWRKYECVVFHETDLPFGRGGSPIQNLIARGIYKTKISALKVDEGIDTGGIYMKKDADISEGTIKEILTNTSNVIFKEMIPYILQNQLKPIPQEGKVVVFKRRTPEQGDLTKLSNPSSRQLYDYVRMLDGEGYPRAHILFENGKLEFYNASLDLNKGDFKSETRFVKNEK